MNKPKILDHTTFDCKQHLVLISKYQGGITWPFGEKCSKSYQALCIQSGFVHSE